MTVTPLRARLAVAVAIAAALGSSMAWTVDAAQATQRPPITAPAERTGWWMRVNPSNQATTVFWRFGAAANRLGAPISWQRGVSPDAIDLPVEQRALGRVNHAAAGMSPSSPVSFCLFYGEKGVALVEFTREIVLELGAEAQAPECTP